MHHFDADSHFGNKHQTPPLSNHRRLKEPMTLLIYLYIPLSETRLLTCLLFLFLASGAYSRLIVWFQFERSIGFFLIQTYIPAYLIVMLSWIAFWISHNSTPGQCKSLAKKAKQKAAIATTILTLHESFCINCSLRLLGNLSISCLLRREEGTREGQN